MICYAYLPNISSTPHPKLTCKTLIFEFSNSFKQNELIKPGGDIRRKIKTSDLIDLIRLINENSNKSFIESDKTVFYLN